MQSQAVIIPAPLCGIYYPGFTWSLRYGAFCSLLSAVVYFSLNRVLLLIHTVKTAMQTTQTTGSFGMIGDFYVTFALSQAAC
jgi:hypothetical protein